MAQLLSPWFRFFVTYDLRPTLSQVQVPVLAMNGDKDLQVPGPENLEAIEMALRQGGNSDFSIEETFAPIALDVLGTWLEAHVDAATAVVEARADEVPTDFVLAQNYPNPFNGSTIISFTLPQTGPVELSVYNGLGQRVASLVSGMRTAGNYTLHWDGRDERGRLLASGTYLYKLETQEWA